MEQEECTLTEALSMLKRNNARAARGRGKARAQCKTKLPLPQTACSRGNVGSTLATKETGGDAVSSACGTKRGAPACVQPDSDGDAATIQPTKKRRLQNKRAVVSTVDSNESSECGVKRTAPAHAQCDSHSSDTFVHQQQPPQQQVKRPRLKDKRAGVAKKAAVATRVVERQKTFVATGEASLRHMVRARHAEWDEHQAQLGALRDRLERIETQLRSTKRTRRNVRAYNELLARQQETQRELTTLELEAPDIDEFYADLHEFLRQRERQEAEEQQKQQQQQQQQQRPSQTGSANDEVERANAIDAPLNESSGVSIADDNVIVVPLVPLHRAARITAGAPLFDMNQFSVLRMSRADLDARRSMAANHGAENGGSGGAAGGDGDHDAAMFDIAIAKDTRRHFSLQKAARPLLFVLSPAGCGKLDDSAPAAVASVGASTSAGEHASSIGAAGGNQPLMVTIGKHGDLSSSSSSSSSSAAGVKKCNRLKVKMKDIRNMQNMSMLNFVSVQEREATVEEQQHHNFVDFLQQRQAQRDAAAAPRYDDPTCEHCEQPLNVNIQTGMVTCESCGLAYDDGIDCHKWQAIEHVPHSKFEYLKSGHLMTLLKRRQAKESTVIPRDVIDLCLMQLAREKFDLRRVTPKKMKRVLGKVNRTKFYDHIWQLTYIVTGEKPIQFSELQEQEFQAVFDVLEQVYPLFKPKNLENFPFYWYIIRKTAQLLGHPDDVVRSFPLLKSARKHWQKEKLWRNMMQHLNWPYFPSAHDRSE